jgi:hypothetical protein
MDELFDNLWQSLWYNPIDLRGLFCRGEVKGSEIWVAFRMRL